MRAKRISDRAIDHGEFSDPYTGIAAMIFIQAVSDMDFLHGEDSTYRDSSLITKWEILNFLRSDWASFLANSLGLDVKMIEAVVCG